MSRPAANRVFDMICGHITRAIIDGWMSRDRATEILSEIIGVLLEDSWDTAYDSLHRFVQFDHVVAAFLKHDIFVAEWMLNNTW